MKNCVIIFLMGFSFICFYFIVSATAERAHKRQLLFEIKQRAELNTLVDRKITRVVVTRRGATVEVEGGGKIDIQASKYSLNTEITKVP